MPLFDDDFAAMSEDTFGEAFTLDVAVVVPGISRIHAK